MHYTDARIYTRREFEKNAHETDPQSLALLYRVAEQAEVIIRKNLVQGVLKDEKDNTFELRITKDTEVNDNLSIKGGSSSGGCQQQRQPPQKI